ncbi:hypothetical protein SAMN05421539_11830 [Jannaschia seohaensis]|uniref:Uncharacterized protein n=1 Tax=Jannaschia seohaensis TaxID=475081 RepID=A0A2Y9BAJ9_9RHOB|nr:hypothetical protein BCF38_11830 [Jannaschia seohaensis]SSA51279.1 hypothetical protein SAMN05421539_11830 [Jannaschia seohaensis]
MGRWDFRDTCDTCDMGGLSRQSQVSQRGALLELELPRLHGQVSGLAGVVVTGLVTWNVSPRLL